MLTEERQTKKDLKNALIEAKEANRAKSDFLSAMSHDIRTPMNAIMGMTALALAHLDDQNKVEDCLQKITVASKHLLNLINDVLDMSKIEHSKITLNRMQIFLPELMRELSSIMLPQAKEAEIKLDISAKRVSHRYFYGDYLRISQILINLLSNAIKFTPKGGTVDCTVEEIPAVKNKNWIRYRFIVKDTGIGMSEEFLSHIFEPFTRSRRAAYTEGTGLGLSIIKGLIDLMGGEISVESRMNKGSTFQVELECEKGQSNHDVEMKTGEGNLDFTKDNLFAGRRFLVVEDNDINAEILCELLEIYGAAAVIKKNGLEAVEEVKNTLPQTYDAVLMDIQMPEMNGYEATRAIRKMNRWDAQTIPIIAMTANAFAEDIQDSLKAGMNAHVAKPLDIKTLHRALEKTLLEDPEK